MKIVLLVISILALATLMACTKRIHLFPEGSCRQALSGEWVCEE
jgi:competence protein ComGC